MEYLHFTGLIYNENIGILINIYGLEYSLTNLAKIYQNL